MLSGKRENIFLTLFFLIGASRAAAVTRLQTVVLAI